MGQTAARDSFPGSPPRCFRHVTLFWPEATKDCPGCVPEGWGRPGLVLLSCSLILAERGARSPAWLQTRRQPCLLSSEGEASLHLVRPPMFGSVTAAATFSNCGLVPARLAQLAGAGALEPTGLGAPDEAGLHLSTR